MKQTLLPVIALLAAAGGTLASSLQAGELTTWHATVLGVTVLALAGWLLAISNSSSSGSAASSASDDAPGGKTPEQEQLELEELRKQLTEKLEERAKELDAREVNLNGRLVQFQEWLEYPQPSFAEHTEEGAGAGNEPRAAELAAKDQQVLDLLEKEAQQLYEKLKNGHYMKDGKLDPRLARDDALDLMTCVALIYKPDSEMPLLETSVSQLLRAGSRACLHLLIVLERLPLNLEEADLVTVHGYAQKAATAWDLYKAAEPWLGHARNALYAGRIVSGASPVTMGLTWALTELGKRGAKAAATKFVDQQAIAVLHDVVRVVGFEVASIFGGDFRHRDPNWIYAAELTDLMSRFPVSRESLASALREIGSLPLRNEYDRIFLYRCLSTHKAAYPLVDNLELTTTAQRQEIARKLERFFRTFVHGRTRKRIDSWVKDVETRLGVRLAVKAMATGDSELVSAGEGTDRWKAASALVGFLVGAKGVRADALPDRLSGLATVQALTDSERTSFLADVATSSPQFYEVPDIESDSDVLDSFFDDLIRTSVETPPVDLQPDDLVFESATYFGRDLKKTREQLDECYAEFIAAGFVNTAPSRKVDGAIARLILSELPTDQLPRFWYEDIAINSGPTAFVEGNAALIGTESHLHILEKNSSRLLSIEAGQVTAAKVDGLVIDDCHLSGTTWQGPADDQSFSLDLTVKGAVVARYENWFRPLLDAIIS